MQRTVRNLLDTKGRQVWSIAPDASVYDAIAAMAEHHCGALVVLSQDALVGIVSERDYARKVILKGKASKETPIAEIMTTKVHIVEPEQTMESCMQMMTKLKVRHLPVVLEHRVIGVLSIGDVVKALLQERESTIRELEQFIRS